MQGPHPKYTKKASQSVRKYTITKWAKDLNSHLSEQDMRMTSERMEIRSTSYVNKELHIKMTRRYLYSPNIIAKLQNIDTMTGEDVEQQELLFLPSGNATRPSYFRRHLVFSYRTRYALTKWFSNFTPWYSFTRSENLCAHKDVYSSFVYKHQNSEAANTSFSRWAAKYNVFGAKRKWAIKPWYMETLNSYF